MQIKLFIPTKYILVIIVGYQFVRDTILRCRVYYTVMNRAATSVNYKGMISKPGKVIGDKIQFYRVITMSKVKLILNAQF